MPQNSMKDRRPGVGVAVIVTSSRHPNCVVLGKRKGGVGSGLYQLPGGHLEFGNMPQNSMKDRRPGVGVAAIVTSSRHPNCVVLSKRKGGVGSGLYQLPGGHLEFGETWEKAAAREVLEETGLHINNVEVCQVQNTILEEENYHYVTIVMIGEVVNADSCEPINMEPEKCEGWSWVHWNDLPSADKLFWAFRDFYKSGKNPVIK